MITARSSMILAAILLGGCATSDGRPVERTVFNNPYSGLATDRTGIGPQCDVEFGRDATCLGAPLIYPGRGRNVSLGNGEIIRLTRNQRRILRERSELIEALRDQPQPRAPAPPPEPVLPTATDAGSKP
ncbi:MAG: hypothetical protein EDM03_09925 [Porphyrobacter sp. IPPAS B-1204]|nr:MAG: hypothetical protein EDM03_09925 [Porphyrobacter sp. IPPAS B-1204]